MSCGPQRLLRPKDIQIFRTQTSTMMSTELQLFERLLAETFRLLLMQTVNGICPRRSVFVSLRKILISESCRFGVWLPDTCRGTRWRYGTSPRPSVLLSRNDNDAGEYLLDQTLFRRTNQS